jgi:hypothetical protein
MVETITPVVHGGRARWLGALGLHVAGSTLAAGAFGAALGAIGGLLGAPWGAAGAWAIAAVALGYALAELPGVSLPVPQLRRQVPDWWRTFFGPSTTALLYGVGLGIGFLTFLAHGTLVVVAAAAVASGRPAWSAIAVGAFGLARGGAALAAVAVRTADDAPGLVDRLAARSDRSRRVGNGLALVAVAAAAGLAARGLGGGWADLAAAVVAGTFAWSAAAKAVARRRWRSVLAARRLPDAARRVATWAVPAAEALVPALAVLGFRRASAALALALLGAFTVDVVRVRLVVGPDVACGCFGGRRTVPASVQLARNAALGAAAALAVAAAVDRPAIAWPSVPRGVDLLPAAIAATGLAAAALVAWRSAAWLGRAGRA